MPANNQGIAHYQTNGRVWCGSRNAHIAVSDAARFEQEARPCRRCYAKYRQAQATAAACKLVAENRADLQRIRMEAVDRITHDDIGEALRFAYAQPFDARTPAVNAYNLAYIKAMEARAEWLARPLYNRVHNRLTADQFATQNRAEQLRQQRDNPDAQAAADREYNRSRALIDAIRILQTHNGI